jgi:hypothetical protein
MNSGLPAEELRCETTLDSCTDTVRIRVLPESASQEAPPSEAPVQGFDPYRTDIGALTTRPKPRRTLDDMRRLSEAIVRARLSPK